MYNQFFTIKSRISKKNGGSEVVHLILITFMKRKDLIEWKELKRKEKESKRKRKRRNKEEKKIKEK